MLLREAIVAEARSWIGTRWQHQGRIKKTHQFAGGVDCLGLIIGVANHLQLFPGHFAFHHYNRLPHDDLLLQECNRYLSQKSCLEKQAGDILVFRMQSEPQHLAIFSECETLIHAFVPARAVVENAFNTIWQQKLVAVYSYPGI